MQKPITIIFCGNNPSLGAELAAKLRTGTNIIQLCAGSRYIDQAEPHERVIIMPDVQSIERETIKRVYPKAEDYELGSESMLVSVKPEPKAILPIRKRRGRPPKLRVAQG